MAIGWDEIQNGDSVKLRWTGSKRVPAYLNNDWATVVRRNNHGNLVVQCTNEAEGFTRTVQAYDVKEFRKKEIPSV